MRVVILSEVFPKKMGYAGVMLPKYLARLGVDVHVITTELQIYYNMKDIGNTYSNFLNGSNMSPGSMEIFEGYSIHTLKHKKVFGYTKMVGLRNKLQSLRPDIVQTFVAIGHIPLDAAIAKVFLGYKLFSGNHTTASIFPLAQKETSLLDRERLKCIITRSLPGWLISIFTEKCYGATKDCADIAVRFFGVEKRKIDICPLGVDTEIFWPIRSKEIENERVSLRTRFGFTDDEIVCVYTGRFSEDKNPLLLAQAVAQLIKAGVPFRGLFFGNGVQSEAIRNTPGCVVHAFIPAKELGGIYRSADIGVWPTQESISMLDAAACGLPIVVNDTLVATERIEGNGVKYKLNDLEDLIRVLLTLRDPATRKRLGDQGAKKMAADYSWEAIARRRLMDYELALSPR